MVLLMLLLFCSLLICSCWTRQRHTDCGVGFLFDHVQRPRGDGGEGGDWLHLVVTVASVVCLMRGARVILT